jgi:hypothetical protein
VLEPWKDLPHVPVCLEVAGRREACHLFGKKPGSTCAGHLFHLGFRWPSGVGCRIRMYSNRCARDLCIRVLSSWVEPPRVVPSLRIMPSLDVGLVILGRWLADFRTLSYSSSATRHHRRRLQFSRFHTKRKADHGLRPSIATHGPWGRCYSFVSFSSICRY